MVCVLLPFTDVVIGAIEIGLRTVDGLGTVIIYDYLYVVLLLEAPPPNID